MAASCALKTLLRFLIIGDFFDEREKGYLTLAGPFFAFRLIIPAALAIIISKDIR